MSSGPPTDDPSRTLDPLGTASVELSANADLPAPAPPPDRIGDFVIRSVIGEGGMGLVFQAEQQKPRRTVALKVMRPGMVSDKLLRRFEYEAELLGRLEHPNIARIYEAGAADTPQGRRPFFAMEFVRGRPLNDFAQHKGLSVEARLTLIAEIARAVHFAHQQGIIHRDLKPGNILVTDEGVPKVLDFGVARLADSDVQLATMQTDVGQLIGTLPYMSPEQAGGDPNDLDTRSDVYALGVIAYELLGLRLPYQLGKQMIHDAVRIIREQEPSRLSVIDRAFKGDIETIVAKALEKEKARRYQSAAELADDITRYLRDEPIVARPASVAYQVRKFARRNRALVIGVAAVFVALIGGVIASTRFALEANRQRGVAQATAVREQEQRRTAEMHRAESERRQKESQAVIEFINTDVFASAAPDAMPDRAVRDEIVEKMLLPAAAAVRERFVDQPLVAAAIMNQIAFTLEAVGRVAEAEPLYKDALDLRRKLLGDDHPDTLGSLNNHAIALERLGRFAEAELLERESLERRRRVFGDDHIETIRAMNNYAMVLDSLGRRAEAEPLYRDVLSRYRRLLGEDHPYSLTVLGNYAGLLNALGRSQEAEPLSREAYERRERVMGTDHPDTMNALANLAWLLESMGRAAEAEPLHAEALVRRRRVLGADHPSTITSLNNYANVLSTLGRAAEAEPLFRETMERRRRIQGDDHPDTLVAATNYANALNLLGRSDEAEVILRETFERLRRVLGEKHLITFNALQHLAYTLSLLGRSVEAEPMMRQAIRQAVESPSVGASHPRVKRFVARYAGILIAIGHPAEAGTVAALFSIPQAATRPTVPAATQPVSPDQSIEIRRFVEWLERSITSSSGSTR